MRGGLGIGKRVLEEKRRVVNQKNYDESIRQVQDRYLRHKYPRRKLAVFFNATNKKCTGHL